MNHFTFIGVICVCVAMLLIILSSNTRKTPRDPKHRVSTVLDESHVKTSWEMTKPSNKCEVTAPKRQKMGFNSINNKKPCTWTHFKSLARKQEYFPGRGHWELVSTGYDTDMFVPETCHFVNSTPDPQHLLDFVMKKNITKIMTMGDSNGKRHFLAIASILNTTLKACTYTKMENPDSFMPDIQYYTNGRRAPSGLYKTKRRSCNSCGGSYLKCYMPGLSKRTLSLEHLPMTRIIDRSLTTTSAKQNSSYPVPPTFSSQEFYLRSYLQKELPDILIIILPFAHEKQNTLSVSL